MPVSGNEETGVNSFAVQYINLVAGVPIKKRRFPLTPSASPFTEEPCSPPKETHLHRKEQSTYSQGSNNSNGNIGDAHIKKRRFTSCTDKSNAPQRNELSSTSQGSTVSTSSSGLYTQSDASEEILGSSDVTDVSVVQSNLNQSITKPEQPNIESDSHSAAAESKVRVIKAKACGEKLGSRIAGKETVHPMAPKGDLALKIVTKTGEQACKGNCKMEIPETECGTDLALGLKKHLFPALVGQDIDKGCLRQEKSVPVSLNLSLNKKDRSSVDIEAEHCVGGSCNHSKRANWDLNTTMDAREGPVTETKASSPCVDAFGRTNEALDKEPCPHLSDNLGTSISSRNHKNSECESRTPSNPSMLHFEHTKSDGTSKLVSSSSFHLLQDSTMLSLKVNSGSVASHASMPDVAPFNAIGRICYDGTIKPEPFEGCTNQLDKVNSISIAWSTSVNVKHEFFEQSNVDILKSLDVSTLKLIDRKSIKLEPCHEIHQETISFKPICLEKSCPTVKSMSLLEQTINTDVENCAYTDGGQDGEECETCPIVEEVTTSVGNNRSESTAGKDYIFTEDESANDKETCSSKIMVKIVHNLHGVAKDSAIDDEKITCMSEDDSFDSEYGSDGSHALASGLTIEQVGEDNDYEDGEVWEPLVHTVMEDTVREVREIEHVNVNYNDECTDTVAASCENKPPPSHVEPSVSRTAHPSTVTKTECKYGDETKIIQKADLSTTEDDCLQELSTNKKTASDDVLRNEGLHEKSPHLPEKEILNKSLETKLSLDKSTSRSYENNVECADETINDYNATRTDSILPKTEANANDEAAAKDTSIGGNQGRIINLSRASCSSSPGSTCHISGRSSVPRAGRDLLCDALDGEKLHQGRNELYVDKFSRVRHSDQSPRNSKIGFLRGRGRVTSQLEILQSEWESDRDFGTEFYNGPKFQGRRHKFSSSVTDDNMDPDGSFISTGRLGRKPLNYEGPIMLQIIPRRWSPGGREVPNVHGIQSGCRIQRNISPSRSISQRNASELAGIRQSEKFLRGFAYDEDSLFPRSQPNFDSLDGRFTRGNRSFSSIQGRNISSTRSKSPTNRRTRSPCPWSSLRRRSPRRMSPDGFDARAELPQRRSAMYRMERLRSPNRPVFARERIIRRHVSPSYLSRQSNEMRDMDSGRDHGHPRSVISGRSPSGQILLRNRRFNVRDTRNRTNDAYFGESLPSVRFMELDADGNWEERRRFGDRRVPVRSFRPPYSGSVGGKLHLNADDGPRPYRFVTDDDSDFQGRGNIRERELYRRIKSRPTM